MKKDTDVPDIQKAVRVIYEMSEDEKIREMARIREKAMHDEATFLANARQEGREEIIEKMRKSGMTEEQIKRILNN